MTSTTTIDVHEATKHFVELLSWVRSGQEVIVTEHQKPVARVVPVEMDKNVRIPGLHAGQAQMSDDFDQPLPDEFWNGTPLNLAHVLALETLPLLHKDPFDRLLIAQATTEAIPLVGRDPQFGAYAISIEW